MVLFHNSHWVTLLFEIRQQYGLALCSARESRVLHAFIPKPATQCHVTVTF